VVTHSSYVQRTLWDPNLAEAVQKPCAINYVSSELMMTL
jgi:hypothetical protein